MNLTLSTKQIIILAVGICALGAVVAISIWAATIDSIQARTHEISNLEKERTVIVNQVKSNENRSRKPVSATRSPKRPTASERSDIRIESSQAIKQTQDNIALESPRHVHEQEALLGTYRTRPEDSLAMESQQPSWSVNLPYPEENHKQEPDSHTVSSDSDDSQSQWEEEIWNVASILRMVGQSVGLDETNDDERQQVDNEEARQAAKNARSSWAGLAYLGLGTFLLKQMDLLLRQQPEPVDPAIQLPRSMDASSVWARNALNVLFVDPEKYAGNLTDGVGSSWEHVADEIVNNEMVEANAGDFDANSYARAMLSLINAVKTENDVALDCIWNLFCHELNKRAMLEGVAGAVARMNSVILEVMFRSLPPHRATSKLVTSLLKWQQLECNTLFPSCNEHVALPYLLQLAAINDEQIPETSETSA